MSSQHTTHLPVGSTPMGAGASECSERPVVLIAFAKLILLAGVLAVFMPPWLTLMGDLAYGPPPKAWDAFWVIALTGGGGLLAVMVMFLKVWTRLLKRLARAD